MTATTQNVQVLGSVFKMLGRYMDAEQLQAPALRQAIASAEQESRVSIERWWQTLDALQALSPTPALGITIGRYLEVQDVGVLGFLISSCNTLAEATVRLQRFEAIVHNLSYSWARTDKTSIQLGWEGKGNVSTILSNDVLFSGLLTLLNKLTQGPEITPLKVELWHVPVEQLPIYEKMLGCEVVTSDRQLSIHFPLSLTQRAINNSNLDLLEIIEQQAKSILATLPTPDSFLQHSQEIVSKHLDTGMVTASWLATQLELSERSLHRKLRERGHSYQGLLDSLRQQLATQYLQSTQLDIADISLMLGYSEQSAFSRAFKKWTGHTPMRYRKAQLAQP